ncbi:MAG: cation:proton antiporter [Candidatus Doudnabacteria bacterium]|nr:cation:proton antiporter [Candidatus Doudnabacteria bacterium]
MFVTQVVFAAEDGGHATEGVHSIASTLLWIVVILISAKLASLIEKAGQPAVLGELVIGLILGNLVLLGISLFEPIKADPIIAFLSEFGVIILLFQVGLESNIKEMMKVGPRSLAVAIIGVVVPFLLGWLVVGPWLLPGLPTNAYLFLGAALTATSVGITARVFKDLGKLNIPEAKIVLGAAVIDDVLGLIILAVVSALVTLGAVSLGGVSVILGKAIVFLVGAVVIGQYASPLLCNMFSRIHTGVGMKMTIALGFALVFSYLAEQIGLAPIVGAFAAGLVLDPVHFRFFRKPQVANEIFEEADKLPEPHKKKLHHIADHLSDKHVEELIEPIALLLVPIFFVYTGMTVRLETLFDPKILLVALGVSVIAVAGKYVSGLAAGNVNKHLVGFGMVPRGEVGLIFATIGRSLGVVSEEVFSVIVIMVIITTLFTPPILSMLLKRN